MIEQQQQQPIKGNYFVKGFFIGILATIGTYFFIFAIPLIPFVVLGFIGYIILQFVRKKKRYGAGLLVGYGWMVIQAVGVLVAYLTH